MTLAEDRFAVIETLDRYAVALDTRDWPLLDRVFTPDAVGDYGDYRCASRDEIRKLVERMLGGCGPTQHLLGVYRRKLAAVPLDLDRPYWIDDPDLDLDFHIRALALPRPGTDEQLGEQVARIVARPLDRSRPLWEWYVITGLEGDRVGVLTKIHHATIDGASGVELIQLLLETDPGYARCLVDGQCGRRGRD